MPDPRHFERRAEVYDAARPPYPPALWERVRATGLMVPGRRALDLGAGTGQATGPLLDAGLRVVAVEPGPRLAARLREAHPEVEVIVARAEDVEFDAASFDLVVVATALHWMDLAVVLPTVRRALAPDGRLLVWRNVFGDPDAPVTPFRQAVGMIVARRSAVRPGSAEDAARTAEAIARDGLFSIEEVSAFRWSIELDADRVRDLFSTFSDWSADEVDEAAAAARALGGSVVEHYSSWLIEAAPAPV